MASKRDQLIESLKVEIELAEKAGASAKVITAMQRDAAKIQKTIDSINAKGPAEAMSRLEKAVNHMGGVAALSDTQIAKLAARVSDLAKAGAAIPATFAPMVESVNKAALASARAAEIEKAHAEALIEVRARQAKMDKLHTDAIVENRARAARAAVEEASKTEQAAQRAMASAEKMNRLQMEAIVEDRERARRSAAAASDSSLLGQIASRGSIGSGVAAYGQGLIADAGVGATAGPAGAAVAASAVVLTGTAAALGQLVAKTIAHADALKTEAATAQVSIETLQRWRFALRESNADVSSAVPAMVDFNKTLAESPQNFEKWGLSAQRLRELKPEEQMQLIADTLTSMSSSSERAAAANDFFGRSGAEMLKGLVNGWAELTGAADEYGAVMSEQDVANLEELGSAWERMGGAIETFSLQIGNALAKSAGVEDMATAIDMLARAFGALGGFVDKHGDQITSVIAYLSNLSPTTVAGLSGLKLLFGMTREAIPSADPPATRDMRAFKAVYDGLKASSEGFGKLIEQEEQRKQRAAEKALDAQRSRDAKALDAEKDQQANLLALYELSEKRRLEHDARMAGDLRGSITSPVDALLGGANPAIAIPQAVLERASAQEAASRIMATASAREAERKKAEEVAKILEKQGWSQKQINEALGRTVDKTMTWAQFGQVVANQLSSMGALGGTIGKAVGGVAGIGAMFEKGGALEGGVGKIFSGGLKGLAGGVTAAFAAFDIGKTLYSVLHKTEAQKIAFDVGRDYGVQISEGLSKEIAKNSKTMGREAASLLSLDKIIGEAGGVSAFGVDKTIGKMRDLFSMIQAGKMTADQAKKPFDALFGEVAQASISKTTGMISLQVRELMALSQAPGMKSDAVDKFRNEQRSIADTILNRLADNKAFVPSSAAAAQAFGGALAAQYRAMVEKGLSGAEIADKLGPEIDKIQAKLAEGGFGGGEQFDAIVGKVAMFRDELTGPTAQAISDVTGLAVALYNSGDLTRDQFVGLANQVGGDFMTLQKQLADQGGDPAKAYANMAGDLQKLWEMQRRYGVTLDEQTQSILTQAEANGTVGEAQMSAQDRMAEGIDRLNLVMERVGEQLGASFDDLPSRAKTAAQGVTAALAGITAPELTIPTDMSAYNTGVNGGRDLSAAIQDLGSTLEGGDIGASVGDAVSPGLQAIAEGMAGLAGQPVQTTTVLKLEDGSIAASITNSVDRGGPAGTAFITALAAKLKGRL